MTSARQFTVGDYVVLDGTGSHMDGQVFSLVKVNPKTLTLDPLDGGTGLRADRGFVRRATHAEIETAKSAAASAPAPLFLGSVVKVRGRSELYVVIGLPSGRSEFHNVCVLGGDQNRYLRCRREGLTLVDAASLQTV